MGETYGIEGNLVQGLVDQLAPGDTIPSCAENSFGSNCAVRLNRTNGRLVRGTSAAILIKFWSYCSSCDLACGHGDKSDPLCKIRQWSFHWLESFDSRDSVQQTMMTVVAQGFASGPATYQPSEVTFLCTLAQKSVPRCFWTGLPLSLSPMLSQQESFLSTGQRLSMARP